MAERNNAQMRRVQKIISEMTLEPVTFLIINDRQCRRALKGTNDATAAFFNKVVRSGGDRFATCKY